MEPISMTVTMNSNFCSFIYLALIIWKKLHDDGDNDVMVSSID